MVEDEYLKSAVMSLQDEPAENPAVETAEVPLVPKEDVPPPTASGDGHPVKELAEPVEGIPEVSIPEVCVQCPHACS